MINKKNVQSGYQGLRGGGNGEILVKGYKLPRHLMYSKVTIVNNTVLYT